MAVASITKRFEFSAAHILVNHPGKCKNLHGHNYTVEVTLEKEIEEKTGMVMDFADLKTIVKPHIDWIDHSFIYGTDGPLWLVNSLQENGLKTYLIPYSQSTAENLARHFAHKIANAVWAQAKQEITFNITVSVWETADSCATYTAEG